MIKKIFLPFLLHWAAKAHRILQDAQANQLRRTFAACGQNVALYMPLCVEHAENVRLGDNVSIAAFVHIWGQGGITIGNRVMIASHAVIAAATHDYKERFMYQTLLASPIIIEDDAWIGAHAVIMPGLTIGRGAVVGSGAIVTKDVEPYSIVVGAPARLLKYREIHDRDEERSLLR